MYLSKNIRYLRKKHLLSQEALATKFGYKSFTTIQKWEMGVSEPPAGVVKDLAQFFNVDIDSLMKVDLEANESVNKTKPFSEEEIGNISRAIFFNANGEELFITGVYFHLPKEGQMELVNYVKYLKSKYNLSDETIADNAIKRWEKGNQETFFS